MLILVSSLKRKYFLKKVPAQIVGRSVASRNIDYFHRHLRHCAGNGNMLMSIVEVTGESRQGAVLSNSMSSPTGQPPRKNTGRLAVAMTNTMQLQFA